MLNRRALVAGGLSLTATGLLTGAALGQGSKITVVFIGHEL
jgi:hypothetical protein